MIEETLKYKDWDKFGELSITLYEVETLVDIGNIKSGSKFEIANIDYEKGDMEFFKTGKEREASEIFKLKLNIKQKKHDAICETSEVKK